MKTTPPTTIDLNRDLERLQDDHLDETGRDLRIDVGLTMSGIFGCLRKDIDQLCEISDVAANVRYDLIRNDLNEVADTLDFDRSTFIMYFVEWEKVL